MKSFNAELLLALITVIWGTTFSFTKIGLSYSTPFVYSLLRFSIALAITLIIWHKNIFRISKPFFVNGMILGVFYAGGFALQTIGLNYTTITKSAFITGLSVAFTPIVYRMINGRKIPLNQKLGIIVATIGLWLFTKPDFENINIGDALTLVSAFFWAFYLVFINKYTEHVEKFENTIQLVFCQFLMVTVISVLGLVTSEIYYSKIELHNLLVVSLLFNGIIASVVLTTIHTHIQKFTTPVKAALIFSFEPVFAAAFAMFIFNEVLAIDEYIGALVLFIGILISELGGTFRAMLLKIRGY